MILAKSRLYEFRLINFEKNEKLENMKKFIFFRRKNKNNTHYIKLVCKENNLTMFSLLTKYFDRDPGEYLNFCKTPEMVDYIRENTEDPIILDYDHTKKIKYTSYSIMQYVIAQKRFKDLNYPGIFRMAVVGNDNKLLKYASRRITDTKFTEINECLWQAVKNDNLSMFVFLIEKGAIELDRAYVLAEQYSHTILDYMISKGWWI